MKIEVFKSLTIPEIKVIRFSRFADNRGFFTEVYNLTDITKLGYNWKIAQVNESYSIAPAIRGLHFQWNPYMGKLVRTVQGHMVDLILDIRLNSPTFGKLIGYDMPSLSDEKFNEWIWIPPGFAHGNLYLENTTIQYLCSGEYNSSCESGISPMSKDIDISLCDENIANIFNHLKNDKNLKISDKDREGQSLKQWVQNINSKNFIY